MPISGVRLPALRAGTVPSYSKVSPIGVVEIIGRAFLVMFLRSWPGAGAAVRSVQRLQRQPSRVRTS
jgi:hypothetical protein